MSKLKGLYVKQSYPNDFVNFFENMYEKYGESIFSTQGIANKHMDVVEFSKNFFGKSSNVADISIDGNANVKEKNIMQYNHEFGKAFQKLNSIYLLYKWVGKCFDMESAKLATEKIINGELFVNDLTNYAMPYSYYQETPIYVRINGVEKYITMKQLFNYYSEFAITSSDKEEINLNSVYKEIDFGTRVIVENSNGRIDKTAKGDEFKDKVKQYHNIEVRDGNGKWTGVSRVLRHKNEKDLILYQTENGDFAFVTEDHPVILADGSEINAGDLKEGLEIKGSTYISNTVEYTDVPDDLAYIIGFIIGDGNVGRHKFYQQSNNLTNEDLSIVISEKQNNIIIYQKDIKNTEIYKKVKNTFPKLNINVLEERDQIRFCSFRFKMLLSKYFDLDYCNSSFTKTLPSNVLSWKKHSKESLIAGLIDSDGTVYKNGTADLRITSYSVITQLADVLSSININGRKRICNNNPDSFLFAVSFLMSDTIKNITSKGINATGPYNKNTDNVSRSNKIKKVMRLNKNFEKLTYAGENILEYVYDITTTTGTFYANGMTQHNCYAFDLRELLSNGMNFFKGNMNINPPTRSDSFIALLIQSTAYISNQIMGASSYPDFFVILDRFYRNELGEDYAKKIIGKENPEWYKVKNQFQNFIYSMNFPFRGSQSAFTNLSVMDKGFAEQLFAGYLIPTGNGEFVSPNLDSAIELSKVFFEYYSDINSKEGIFTFPVMTIAISLDDNNQYIDPKFVEWAAEANSEKALANIFQSKPNAFSSCCRLKNDFSKVSDSGYQNSFGVGGLSIGSHRVAGLNLPRIALLEKDNPNILEEDLDLLHKILYSHRQLVKHIINTGNLPLYDAGWIHLSKQYSTIGFIGAYEYVVNKGYSISTKEGVDSITSVLSAIESKIVLWQEAEKAEKNIYNIEQIPGESMAVRLADIDYELGYNNCSEGKIHKLYSNQYIPLIHNASIYDRLVIQGKIDSLTSGGAIAHINVDDEKALSPAMFKHIMNSARELNVVYFAINYAYSECSKKHFSVGKHDNCPLCDAEIICQYTRVVGFVTPVKSWNSTRRDYEYDKRVFYKNSRVENLNDNQ